MPTVIDLGQKVKVKYPQYNDLSDEDLGRKIKAKYPGSYDDFTDTPVQQPEQPGLLRRGLNALTGSEQAFGKTLGGAAASIGVGKQITEEAGQDVEAHNRTLQAIQQARAEGRTDEANRLAQQMGQRNLTGVQAPTLETIIPESQKSAKQIFGEGAGVVADILSAGTYGNAAKVANAGMLYRGAQKGATGWRALATEGAILGAAQGGSQAAQQDKSIVGGALTGGVLGGATGGLLGGIGSKLQRKTIAPFAGQIDEEAVAATQRLGLSPTATQVSKSKPVALIETSMAKGLGGNKLVEKIERFQSDATQIADRLVRDAGKTSSRAEIGTDIVRAKDKMASEIIEIKNELYKQVPEKELKLVQIDPTETLKVVQDIVTKKRGAGAVAQASGFFEGLLKDLKNQQYGANTRITGENMRYKIQELGRRIKNWNDPITSGAQGELKRVYAAMSQDFDGALSSQNPQLKALLDRANSAYEKGKQLLDSELVRTIEKLRDKPDVLAKTILSEKTSVAQIDEILNIIGADNANNLRASLLEELLSKSKANDGRFRPQSILTNLKKYGDERLNKIFTPEQVQTLKDLGTATATLAKVNKIAEGSQTAFILRTIAQFGSFFANPLQAIGLIFGDMVLGRFISSPAGQQLLREGVNNPQIIQQAGRAVERVGQVGSRLAPKLIP